MKIKLPTCTDYENNYQDKFVHFRVAVALDHFSFKLSEFYLTPSIQKAANTLFPDYDWLYEYNNMKKIFLEKISISVVFLNIVDKIDFLLSRGYLKEWKRQ